jgi:hypothetical protein
VLDYLYINIGYYVSSSEQREDFYLFTTWFYYFSQVCKFANNNDQVLAISS